MRFIHLPYHSIEGMILAAFVSYAAHSSASMKFPPASGRPDEMNEPISPLTVAVLVATWFACPTTQACQLPTIFAHSVTGITDARTLKLDDGSELRLMSILPATSYDSPAAPKLWPPGAAALAGQTQLSLYHNVDISLERTALNRYGRRTGHALLVKSSGPPGRRPPGAPIEQRWLQALMVQAGDAPVALSPETDIACAKLLLNLEAQAQLARRGLWSQALYQTQRVEDTRQLLNYRSTYQIVEGTASRVFVSKSEIYLNFGTSWKRDFTAKIGRAVLKRTHTEPNQLKHLTNRAVCIPGWIEKRNGPMIAIWRLEQIELLLLRKNGNTQRHTPPMLLAGIDRSQLHPQSQSKSQAGNHGNRAAAKD
jgi:micrococcal nuclease